MWEQLVHSRRLLNAFPSISASAHQWFFTVRGRIHRATQFMWMCTFWDTAPQLSADLQSIWPPGQGQNSFHDTQVLSWPESVCFSQSRQPLHTIPSARLPCLCAPAHVTTGALQTHHGGSPTLPTLHSVNAGIIQSSVPTISALKLAPPSTGTTSIALHCVLYKLRSLYVCHWLLYRTVSCWMQTLERTYYL